MSSPAHDEMLDSGVAPEVATWGKSGGRTSLGGRCVAAVAILAGLLTSGLRAEDTVLLSTTGGGRTKIAGNVVDYNGRELVLQLDDGQQRSFPAERVLHVETTYGPEHTQADALFAKHQFEPAATLYAKAMEAEKRRWVRRQIVAQLVRCYAGQDRIAQAGEQFLLLVRDDPDTIHFDCIPLGWVPRQPSVELESAARQWIARTEPAARLLGASHLLTGQNRPEALRHLRQLAAGDDRRIALLAIAQTWRAEIATATTEQIDGWARLIEQIPEPLAAGPYFVLGQAHAQRGAAQQAALALLRVAILYPNERPLAAQSLVEAGRALERNDQDQEALRLYREAIDDYPEQLRPAAEAQRRLDQLAAGQ